MATSGSFIPWRRPMSGGGKKPDAPDLSDGTNIGSPVLPPLDRPPESIRVSMMTPLAEESGQRAALIVVLAISFAAAAWVASELLDGLLLGMLAGFAMEPLHRRILPRVDFRPGLAAAISVSAMVLVGVGLLGLLLYSVSSEVGPALGLLQSGIHFEHLGPHTVLFLARLGVPESVIASESARAAAKLSEFASTAASSAVSTSARWVPAALVAAVAAFQTLRDPTPIETRLARLLPLNPRVTCELVATFRNVGRGTLLGSLFAGVLQGAFATVGFALSGLNHAVLLGILTALAALVPAIGTLLVSVPVSIFLIVKGHVGLGLFQLAWGILITSSLVDYVIRPLIAGRECRGHPFLALVGVIGGLEMFGPIGLIAGPLIMTFFACALSIYEREVVEPIRRRSAPSAISRCAPVTGVQECAALIPTPPTLDRSS